MQLTEKILNHKIQEKDQQRKRKALQLEYFLLNQKGNKETITEARDF